MSTAGSASTSKQAEAPPARPRLSTLADEAVYILETHFDAQRRGILEQTANALGAATAQARADATIVIVNPRHHTYRQELDAAQRAGPGAARPTLIPYHWLAACRIAGARVDPATLNPPVPYFVHPDRSAEHQPLRAWVSVNIHRGNDGGPHEAKRAVQDMLELGGCVITERRAVADLLVVDKASKFYEGTVLVEVKNNSRTWQRIVERDWVEACVKQQKMQWPARGWSERSDAADSMEEEDAVGARGPGRPKGKPRVEYTPAEDDFLCRYLAAWHPDGAWLSRKTFEIMTKRGAQFPMVEHHSSQSWHERFKKNSGALTNRVNRYMHAGIRDTDLKTAKEVEHAEQAEASAAAAAGPSASLSTVIAERPAQRKQAQEDITPSRADPPKEVTAEAATAPAAETGAEDVAAARGEHERTTVAEREGARLTQIAAQEIEAATNLPVSEIDRKKESKQLVDADDSHPKDERPGPSRRRKTPLPAESATLGESKQGVSTRSVEQPALGEHTVIAPVTPLTLSTSDAPGTGDAAPNTTILQPSETVPHQPSEGPKQTATDGSIGAPVPMALPAIEIAQAPQEVVDAVQAENGDVTANSNPTPPDVTVQVVTIAVRDDTPLAAPANDAARTDVGPAVQAGLGPAVFASPRADSRSPKKVRLDIEPSPERQAPPSPASGSARDGSPAHFLVRDIRDITKPTRPRQSLPAHLAGTPNRITQPRFSTPILTPRKRSLMQDHMLSSEKKKRRRSLDPAQTISHTPDVVMASTRFPPARVQDPNVPPPPPIIPRSGPPPPMTQDERHNKILSGQAVAMRHRDEYKRHVKELCDKYGIAPRDVSDFANAMPKRRNATGELYWRDVEAGLHERFGRGS